jgi:low temperature requirement protein LtrA
MEDEPMSEPQDLLEAPDRIEWLELFFDLVVVAAVAVFSEALREDATWGGLGIFLVTYGAVWFAWVTVVMYTDVAGELTRVRTVGGLDAAARGDGGSVARPRRS